MDTTRIATTARHTVQAFGTTAHSAIGAAREGGERLGQFASKRWNLALREASPQLTPETRRNAARTRKLVGRCYTRGLEACTTGAERAVDLAVQAACAGIERASTLAQARAGKAA